MSKGESKKQRK